MGDSGRNPRWDSVYALAAALLVFAVYAATAANYVTGEDAGELIAAAYHLGIPHPPGYPLWCLVAHAFTWLPFGSIPWRVALCSAFFGAAAVFVLARLFQRLSGSPWAGALAAVAVGLSHEFWKQSIIPEVYTLNAFFVALCWWLLVVWNDRRDDRLLWAFAVAYGLSLGNHNTMHLLGPVFGAFIALQERRPYERGWFYFRMLGIALFIAFALHLLLPVRSLADPPVDWGNPETPGNLWRHVSRGQYTFMLTEAPRSLPRLGMQAAVTAEFWWEQYRLWSRPVNLPFLVALAGWAGLLRFRRAPAILLLVSGVVVSIAFALVQNFDNTLEWRWVMSVFGLPLYMATGAGIAWLLAHAGRRTLPLAAVLVLAMVLGLVGPPNQRGNDVIDRYARASLECLPPEAILVPLGDHQSFPTLYLQAVEGIRTDVSLARKYGYLDATLWSEAPDDLRDKWGEFPPRRYEPEMLAWLLEHSTRPIYAFGKPALPDGTRVRLADCNRLTQLQRDGEAASCACEGQSFEPRAEGYLDDYTVRVIMYESLQQHAADAYDDGDIDAAHTALEQAVATYGEDVMSLYNAAVIAARARDYTFAQALFARAAEVAPDHQPTQAALDRLRKMGESN